ncbi:MAG: ATP-binding protein [Desulfovibrionaceae bacterium]|nr:ATP-binding protein [Desulfovibrionaceae bacterium]
MRIAIASGKGGTGKTTVAANLARIFSGQGRKVCFVDCDVEEPNAHFFLKPNLGPAREEYVPVPEMDPDRCLGAECRKCIELCRFKALIWMADEVMSFPELCHGCGLCQLACPARAVGETTRLIGTSASGRAGDIDFHMGLLRIGEAMAPPLIKAVKARAQRSDIEILDCPPGTSCPVVESVQGADYVLLVAEPTPFGLHDLGLAVNLMRKLGLRFGAAVNRAGMGDGRVEGYLEDQAVPLLGSLPHTREAAAAYSRGEILVEALPEFKERCESMARAVLEQAAKEAGR